MTYCGYCGFKHSGDCGPDPDGSFPCINGHFGCAVSLRGACDSRCDELEDVDAPATFTQTWADQLASLDVRP